MYVPRFNAMDDAAEIVQLVRAVGSAQLITVADGGFPAATLLPVLWNDDRLVFHMARANPHWRSIGANAPALAVVSGPEAYVSPSWYPSKSEHGRVVPTWNYFAVQFTGRVTLHEDPEWLLAAVTRLTEAHEQRRSEPWAVGDAPPRYIEKQLRAIVGIDFAIEQVEAKAKLSQNRDDADAEGVIDGLRREGGWREYPVADAMAALRPAGPPAS